VSEPIGKNDTELAIETFVDRMKEIHPNLDGQEFHDTISRYVQEAVTAAEGEENEEEPDSEE
jgi:hypothetical protein